MSNNVQLDRYTKLLTYLEDHLSEEINIEKVEDICHYSYRNINRIFLALNQETIGQYIKRLRLEKAAQYLKYSEMGISQIAYTVGYEDRSAFSKAFKKKYHSNPKEFRESAEEYREEMKKQFILPDAAHQKLEFKIETLPEFQYLFTEYRGDFRDTEAMDLLWEKLIDYALKLDLLSEDSVLMTEIVDDADISDHIHSRYRQALILENPIAFAPQDFRLKTHKRQKYAKFTHQGTQESTNAFYNQIYALWMLDVQMEIKDLPVLEFYPNYYEELPESDLITEIYIAIS